MEDKALHYVDPARKPYPFCPGCSHSLILDAIDRSLHIIEADPKRTLMVTDIGCLGMSDRFFDVHTLHGLHGRSFTYASGAKLADPGLNVINLVGDGGCGIGGNHLIHAARRNIGITVIVFNNFNFGMTGGQHSSTTPIEGITSTTPDGNYDNPMNISNIAVASGATHVVRVSAFDKNLDQIIADAMQHEGFALVEILELCTAYFSPRNKFRKKELENRLEELGGSGILQSVSKPEYSATARQHWPEKPKNFAIKGTAQKFEHKLPKHEYDLLLAGSAGMKVISAASNLGQASLYCGLWTSQKDDYPVTVQSGHSTSMLKFSQSRINYTGVNSPDGAIIISENGLNEVRHELEEMSPEGLVIADSKLDIETPARLLKVDFAAAKISKFNIIGTAVALFLLESEIMPVEALIEVINSIPKEKIREENFKAIEAAEKLYQELEKTNG